MSDSIKQLLVLFDEVGMAIHKKVCSADDNALADKLSLSQIKVLQLVTRQERVSMADIAKHLAITPASATSSVDKLVQMGWLKRQSGDQDRRKVWIVLSEEQKPLWEQYHAEQMKRLSEFLDVLDKTKQEQLIHILQDLVKQDRS